MKLIPIDETQANELTRNRNIRWEGWDLLIWSPNPHAEMQVRGAFNDGRWGIMNRVTVGTDGKWRVPAKYV